MPYFACLHQPGAEHAAALIGIAEQFSPRYERRGRDLLVIDVAGLERLLGPPAVIAEDMRREAAARGVRVHIALAATCSAASVLAHARPGVTVVERGQEKRQLAPLPIRMLRHVSPERESLRSSARDIEARPARGGGAPREVKKDGGTFESALSAFNRWGVKTLGELAALPSAELAARLGTAGRLWQALARGEDLRPLVPDLPEERFESSLELEWPIEGLEPLSFVLTRLLEPLSTRLERRDRGAAGLLVELRLVTRASPGPAQDLHVRRLELPSPMRDARTLRTLALLDLESHPPPAAIDRVRVVIEPTPGRVLQHTLFARACPAPEQLATLVARLGALMGQDRIGSPATVDSYKPGAFALQPFATDHDHDDHRRDRGDRRASLLKASAHSACSALNVVNAVRRCRQPVPARVAVDAGSRPIRVTTDRQGFAGGAVVSSTGPWRSSGYWWEAPAAMRADGQVKPEASIGVSLRRGWGPGASKECFDRDDWDVALDDGAVYQIFRDRPTGAWFIDAVVD